MLFWPGQQRLAELSGFRTKFPPWLALFACNLRREQRWPVGQAAARTKLGLAPS